MRPDMRAEEEEGGEGREGQEKMRRKGQEKMQREGRRGVWEPGKSPSLLALLLLYEYKSTNTDTNAPGRHVGGRGSVGGAGG
jgi:hypothetical protein